MLSWSDPLMDGLFVGPSARPGVFGLIREPATNQLAGRLQAGPIGS
jgi:hypothetical protein